MTDPEMVETPTAGQRTNLELRRAAAFEPCYVVSRLTFALALSFLFSPALIPVSARVPVMALSLATAFPAWRCLRQMSTPWSTCCCRSLCHAPCCSCGCCPAWPTDEVTYTLLLSLKMPLSCSVNPALSVVSAWHQLGHICACPHHLGPAKLRGRRRRTGQPI